MRMPMENKILNHNMIPLLLYGFARELHSYGVDSKAERDEKMVRAKRTVSLVNTWNSRLRTIIINQHVTA